RGLTDQLQQMIAAAQRGRHLIHHAAGRADDEVLPLLRQTRDRALVSHLSPRGPRRAPSRASSPPPPSGATASSVATSSAADELKPLPTGTSERTDRRSPCRSGFPPLPRRGNRAAAA